MSPDEQHYERSIIREDREMVLDYLNIVYPQSMLERELLDGLLDLDRPIDSHKARRDLAYLQGRGLLRRFKKEHPLTKRPQQRVELTPNGLTFCERDKPWDDIEDLKD